MRSLPSTELLAASRAKVPGSRTQELQEADESELHTNVQAGGQNQKTRKNPVM